MYLTDMDWTETLDHTNLHIHAKHNFALREIQAYVFVRSFIISLTVIPCHSVGFVLPTFMISAMEAKGEGFAATAYVLEVLSSSKLNRSDG